MKLRQKLAMVLATAMVVTAVPVVTMAASDNRVTNVVKVTEGATLGTNVAPELVIDLKDGMTTGDTFYVTLENATFAKDADGNYILNGTAYDTYKGVDLTVESEKELSVKLSSTGSLTNNQIRIPMITKVKSGEAKAHIEETKVVSGANITFATTQSGAAVVTVGTTSSFYSEGGKLADIVITEGTLGALAETADNNGKVEIVVAIDSSEFEFNNTPQVKLDRGFASSTTATVVNNKDELVITVDKTALENKTEKGRITITGATVKTDKKAPTTGELKVEVLNNAVKRELHTVANVAEYGVKIQVKEDKVVELTSGNKKAVQFTLKENVASTIASGRKVEFTLDKGYFDKDSTIKVTHKQDGTAVEKGMTVVEANYIKDKDGNITGFEYVTNTNDAKLDSLVVDATVVVPMDKDGEITVSAEGRAIGDEVTAVIAKAAAAVTIESTGFDVNAGVKGQKGGKLVITETNKGMLQKGNLEFYLPLEDGIKFTKAPVVEVVKGDIKLDTKDLKVVPVYKLNDAGEATSTVTGYKVVVPVTRVSREAATIEVKDFEVTLDRNVPSGTYNLEVKGSAIGTVGKLKQEGFFNVGIKDENAAQKIVTTITKDATAMVVNGKKVELPAAAYINGNKLMAPLRAVANAFGFENSAINYNSATKEILIRGNRSIIKLTIGSKQAFVNGTPITLAVPAEIKAEATYVPVGDLGRLLGIKVDWDNATKTATFKN